MKKLSLFFLILMSFSAFSQVETPTQNSKWTFGGYAGLTGGFGSNSGIAVHITPRVGYKISENLEAGLMGSLNWQNSSYSYSTLFGIGPFVNYYLGRNFYLGSQFQEYFINQKVKSSEEKYSSNEAALYIGGGYMQRMGNNSYLQIGGMYNVLWKQNSSIFSSGFVPNIGVVFGL